MATDKNIETHVYYYCLDVIVSSSSNQLDVNNIQSMPTPIKRRTPIKEPPSIELNSEGVGSFVLSVKSYFREHDKEIPLSKNAGKVFIFYCFFSPFCFVWYVRLARCCGVCSGHAQYKISSSSNDADVSADRRFNNCYS